MDGVAATGSNLLLTSGAGGGGGGGGGGRETLQRDPPAGAGGSGKPVSARVKQKIKEADATIFSRLKLTGIEVQFMNTTNRCYFCVLRWSCG